jgi:flavin-dependent dehydrogenase
VSYDALVVGGGLAGGIAALELARTGRRVVLVEKSKGPHDKVCGEFLSRESLHYLKRHNVDLPAMGAVPIESVRLITKTFAEQAKLPFAAMSLTRKRLDEELLRLAAAASVEIHRGSFVDELKQADGTWSAHLRDGRVLRASHALLATGKHDLRGRARPQGTHRGLVGFKMYYRLTANQASALGHAVELILFRGGYAGLQPVEHGAANLCLLVHEDRLRQAGSNWAGLLQHLQEHSPHLAKRLQGATPLLNAPLATASIPYGHLQRTAPDDLWRVGDQAAVIPSFCGDGMAIALHSGALAAAHLLQGRSADAYQRRLYGQLATRLWAATKLSQMLVSWPQAAGIVRVFPALLAHIALMTRIPDKALTTAVLTEG